MALADQLAQGVQFAAPQDPFAQYGRMQQLQAGATQNALAQYQLGAAQRSDQEANALRQSLPADFDPSNPTHVNALLRASPVGGAALIEKLAKVKNDVLTGKKTQTDIDAANLKKQMDIAKVAGSILYKVDDQASYERAVDSLRRIFPDGVKDYPAQFDPNFVKFEVAKGLDVEKRIADETILRGQNMVAGTAAAGQGVTMRGQDITAETAKAGQGVTMRGQNMTAGTAAAGQQSQERIATAGRQQTLDLANRPVFNEAAQGFVGRPTAAAPSGTFTPMPAGQANRDQQAAVKALKSAGYDAATGEDNISKLIQQSTSGKLQAGAAATLAFFDITTEGRKAISALAGTANQIATDLAGGKLGAGISNTDRDFIVGALGDVANPNRTSEERLAGWNAAKQRMINVGLVPPPKPVAPKPSGGGAPSPPPGFKPDQ